MDIQITTTIIAALSGVLGAVIGGTISYFSQASISKRERQDQARLEFFKRTEELYILFDQWEKKFTNDFLLLSLVMKDKCDYNQYLDGVIADNEKKEFNFARIPFLLHVYHRSRAADFERIMKTRDLISTIHKAHEQAYRNGDENHGVYLETFQENTLTITAQIQDIQRKLTDRLRDFSVPHL